MPNYTANYNLQKPTPEEFYDVGVQNNNMDVIDGVVKGVEDDLASLGADLEQHKLDYTQQRQSDQLKVAKVEKELSDYKAAMAGLNPNQEAKQVVSGYGVVSLPPNAANGQVSAVVKGQTISQFVKNGNFADGSTGWYMTASTLSVSNNTLSITGDGTNPVVRASQLTSIKPEINSKIFVRAILTVKNSDAKDIYLRLRDGVSGSVILELRQHAPSINTRYILYGICTISSELSNNLAVLLDTIYLDSTTANGKTTEAQEVMAIDLTSHGLDSLTADECNERFPHWLQYGVNSTVSAMRLKSVSEDESEVSMVYVTAKDSEDKIAELRSLPNGTKDEVRLSDGKMIKRVSDLVTIREPQIDSIVTTLTYVEQIRVYPPEVGILSGLAINQIQVYGMDSVAYADRDGLENIGKWTKVEVDPFIRFLVAKGTTLEQVKQQLAGTTLTYQLAEPVEIPIEVSGTLLSYPSGTVYVEPVVADAGVYTDKINVLHQDLPIDYIEKVSKIEFTTGLETELDASKMAINGDKLSFTHPDLTDGDIVFFTYFYSVEGTQGETIIEYYDSRHVLKDSVTGKFYKVVPTVADGVLSNILVEV